jgi:hypothetical protein
VKLAAVVVICCVWLLAAACGDDGEDSVASETPTSKPAPYAGYVSEVYADIANWLCHPDADDFCDADLDATIVNADGSTEVETFEPAEDPPIDCFYVYPTISMDEEMNSDLVPDPEAEGLTVRNQAARLASQCRLYAPMYRQRTLTALIAGLASEEPSPDEEEVREIAYGSALDAWKHYIDNINDGRGVVLVGHSQGSGVLNRLIQEEIDGDEQLRGLLVSALLLGSTVMVPEGEDVGGSFANVPLCRDESQTGCVITYASFRDTAPPPADSYFGEGDEGVAACTNPGSLGGGPGVLQPYFETEGGGGVLSASLSSVDQPWAVGAEITTPWVTLPDFVEAECVVKDGFSYLEITVLADPADPRIDDIGGDIPELPSFGLHIVDVSLAMGDLVEIVGSQAEAYVADGE